MVRFEPLILLHLVYYFPTSKYHFFIFLSKHNLLFFMNTAFVIPYVDIGFA